MDSTWDGNHFIQNDRVSAPSPPLSSKTPKVFECGLGHVCILIRFVKSWLIGSTQFRNLVSSELFKRLDPDFRRLVFSLLAIQIDEDHLDPFWITFESGWERFEYSDFVMYGYKCYQECAKRKSRIADPKVLSQFAIGLKKLSKSSLSLHFVRASPMRNPSEEEILLFCELKFCITSALANP